jgi:transcriptional regulator with XRE-family HTH domain
MTPADLRAWTQQMGYTSYEQAAAALGVSRATYAYWLAGKPAIDRRTALACAALAAGLRPYAVTI